MKVITNGQSKFADSGFVRSIEKATYLSHSRKRHFDELLHLARPFPPGIYEGDTMTSDAERIIELAFPGEDARYFSPMSVGNTARSADEGRSSVRCAVTTIGCLPDRRLGGVMVVVLGDGRH